MKRILPSVAALSLVGTLASCTQAPAPETATPPVVAPAKTDVVTPVTTSSGVSEVTATGADAMTTNGSAMTGSVGTTTSSDTTAPAVPADMSTTTPVTTTPTPASSETTKPAVTTPAPTSKSEVHANTVSYNTPAGMDDVGFSVTVTDGKITAVSVTPKATHDISKMLQGKFRDAIVAQAVGQDLKSLKIHAVGGASLTTDAFVKFISAL